MTNEQKQFIEQLVEDYSKELSQLTYRRTRNKELSRDLVQETFARACANPDDICSHEEPLAWLHLVLRRLTLSELMRAYREREIALEAIENQGKETDFLKLRDHLPHNITKEEETLIILRLGYGLSHAEIAKVQNISSDVCRKRVFRALQKCREFYEREK